MVRFFTKMNTVVALLILLMTLTLSVQAQTQNTEQEDHVKALTQTEISYSTHVSDIGWQPTLKDGATAGTTGQSLAIEAFKINLENLAGINPGSVEYSAHISDIGWTDPVRDGQTAGTEGQCRSAQAIKINLVGDIANVYDVYYRVHSAYYGWLGWAKNGDIAGTTGIYTPAEAIEIRLVQKGNSAPGSTDNPSITYESLAQNALVEYKTQQLEGWQNIVRNGEIAGTVGQGAPVYAITATIPNKTADSRIEYTVHCTNVGWVPETFSDGQVAAGGGNNIEAVCMALKGIDSYSYDLYYQAQVEDYGWLGWAKNGAPAGTTGGGKRLEALRVVMVPRNSAAPGSTENSYLHIVPPPETWAWPFIGNLPYQDITSAFAYRWGRHHDGIDIAVPRGTPIHACKSGTVIRAGSYGDYGLIVIIRNDSGEDTYYAHMDQIGTTYGAHVKQGDVIGYVGSTGNATGPHLHLGVVIGGHFVDPLPLF